MRSKTINKYVLIAISFVFIQCKAQLTEEYINKKNNQIMERLNINDFKKIKQIDSKEKSVSAGFNERSEDPRFRFWYQEENKVSGEKIELYGDKKSGYRKEVRYKDSPYQENLEFYPDGNLRRRVTSCIGNLRKEKDSVLRRPSFSLAPFPVGKEYKYNEDGDVIKEIDHDKGYNISIKDLEQILLDKRKIDLNKVATDISKYSHKRISGVVFINWKREHAGYWFIKYQKPGNTAQIIVVSAETGEILQEGEAIGVEK